MVCGRKIQLFKNFRSRNNILNFTNLIFKNIMSYNMGEVEYDEKEYLNFGAEDYKDTFQDLNTEIDIIDVSENEKNIDSENSDVEYENYESTDECEEIEHIENIEIEAKYVAKKIKDLIENKYQVYNRKNGCFRDVEYRDIAVLLRSTKDKANIYEQEIIKLEIPVFSDSNQEYLESVEIQTIMNVLKIIDNPMQDIPLVAVMRSNIGKFTDDELVEIRLSDKYDNFYNCLLKAKVDVPQNLKNKIEEFLNKIKEWRKQQEYLSLDELIWKIYSETGYYNFVGLMPNGNLRQANLKMLFERAKKYETASFKGLYNFINFIEKLRTSSGDLGAAKIIGENDNVVRIMSIHKSKGLEFPIVFLVNTNKQFNEQDIKKNSVLLHQEMGIGAKYIDYNAQIQYDTLTREAVKSIVKRENISEEMRILYVALTRAKEKLFITGISNDFTKQIENIEKQVNIYSKKNGKINHILVKKYKSYLDWILLVYQYEKNNSRLLELNRINSKDFLKEEKNKEEVINSDSVIKMMDVKQVESISMNDIKDKIEFKYENILATTIPTKTSVTNIKKMKQNELNANVEIDKNELSENKDIVFSKPKFLQDVKEEKISATQKGTLMHLCMQKLNPKEEYDILKIKEIIQDLVLRQIITEKEAEVIDVYKILNFTKSKIWDQLKEAKEIYQEKPFYINIPANKIYEEQLDECILVQGIIDLYYIDKNDKLILLDYKTDYVEKGKEDELVEKYKVQLDLYAEALEQSLQRKVEKKYIYSLYLGKEIEI